MASGTLGLTECTQRDLAGWLARLQPAEVIYDRERIPPALGPFLAQPRGTAFTPRPTWQFDAGHPGGNRRQRHGTGNPRQQAGIHGLGNDVILAEGEFTHASSGQHLGGHRLLGQSTDRLHCRDLHGIVDAAGTGVEGAAEDEGEAEHVVDLVRVVRAAGSHDEIPAHSVSQGRLDLGVRVGAGEDHRVGGHQGHRFGGQYIRTGHTDKHIRPFNDIHQGAQWGVVGEALLVLVEIGAACVDHPLAIEHEDVVWRGAALDQQVHAGGGGGAGEQQTAPQGTMGRDL